MKNMQQLQTEQILNKIYCDVTCSCRLHEYLYIYIFGRETSSMKKLVQIWI